MGSVRQADRVFELVENSTVDGVPWVVLDIVASDAELVLVRTAADAARKVHGRAD